MYVRTYVRICVHVCMYLSMYVCMHACVYVCIYVRMYNVYTVYIYIYIYMPTYIHCILQVSFVLSGEADETHARSLVGTRRKVLQRGDTNGFLMTVPR